MFGASGSGLSIDAVIIGFALKEAKQFKTAGGMDYLNELINIVPTSAHHKAYAEVIEQVAKRRNLITSAEQFNALAKDTEREPAGVLEAVRKHLGLSYRWAARPFC